MPYLYASLGAVWLGIAAVMTVSGHMAPREAACQQTDKGSIVATVNCPDQPEQAVEASPHVSKPLRNDALARARGKSD